MRTRFAWLVAALAISPTAAFAQEQPESIVPASPPPLPPPPLPPLPPAEPPPMEPAPAEPPPPQADAPQLALPQPAPRPRRRVRFFGSFEGGYQFASLYDVSMNGGTIGGLLGADFGRWTVGGRLEGTPMRTEGGLTSFAIFFGPETEVRFGRLRVGGGLRVGILTVDRVTTSSTMAQMTLGLEARLSVDLIRFDDDGHGAFFLVANSSTDIVSSLMYAIGAGAGVRF